MNALVPIALFGWIPVVLLLFAALPPRRAVIWSFMLAWLFLPMAGYRIPGFTEYSKMTATSVGVLLGVVVFDTRRLTTFRMKWFDWPALIWSVCPFFSSLANDMGANDGASLTVGQIVTWGLPYLIGRLYFSDLEGIRELAVGMFIGGLVYMPLCWFELKMSPQLHNIVYGYHQHSFGQTMRYGGWRPTVFMQHGLMVGMWMVNTSLVGLWLWWSGALRKLKGVRVGWWAVLLLATAVACKSTGAIALMLMGLATIAAAGRMRVVWPMVLLIAAGPAYMVARTTGVWSGRDLTTWTAENLNDQQASSIDVRLNQEDGITQFAMRKPVLGWGVWGYEEASGADQLWLLAFRNQGLVGLVSLTIVLLLPALVVCWRFPARLWISPAIAPAVILSLVVLLYLLDCLFNGMVNPIFMLAAGGVTGLVRGQARRPMHAESGTPCDRESHRAQQETALA